MTSFNCLLNIALKRTGIFSEAEVIWYQ